MKTIMYFNTKGKKRIGIVTRKWSTYPYGYWGFQVRTLTGRKAWILWYKQIDEHWQVGK